MNVLVVFMILLGACALLYLAYLVVSGEPVPPAALRLVLLALILMFVLCIAHTSGCMTMPGPVPTP